MRNVGLLKFLAAVQKHNDTSATLMAASGLDSLELQIAVVEAQNAGFIENTGKVHPALTVTAKGKLWAASEMAPFMSLIDPSAMKSGAETWPA